ncbi:MAG: glucuronate isomerase [Bacteroidota bacterium]
MKTKEYINDNFLLQSEQAVRLYHDYAKKMPIIDYHCHLNPKEIADNKKFDNLYDVWLSGDHYKWRALRANGVSEEYITGEKDPKDKFQKWAETVPYTLRNPLYHWTHIELKNTFGITDLLNDNNGAEVYDTCTNLLNTDDYSVQNLIRKSNVEVICTTDDPIDNLQYHKQIKESDFEVKVIPAWRPDKAMAIEKEDFNTYINQLSEVSGIEISTYSDLLKALEKRHQFFHENGCKLSDHGIEEFYADDYSAEEIENIFGKARKGEELSSTEILKFKSAMLFDFAVMDYNKGWTQQFHYGVVRNNNEAMFNKLGPDTGYDSIGSFDIAKTLNKFLNNLSSAGKLSKTILYNINPADNDIIATAIANFQDGTSAGKIQFGSGWWFLDQKQGMEAQMNSLSNHGLLSRFVGMLTDSRSFLSYSRHEYFRRILCDILGDDMEKGLVPNDMDMVGKMVQDICYNNAKEYFKF